MKGSVAPISPKIISKTPLDLAHLSRALEIHADFIREIHIVGHIACIKIKPSHQAEYQQIIEKLNKKKINFKTNGDLNTISLSNKDFYDFLRKENSWGHMVFSFDHISQLWSRKSH
jgi:hypothetical protein